MLSFLTNGRKRTCSGGNTLPTVSGGLLRGTSMPTLAFLTDHHLIYSATSAHLRCHNLPSESNSPCVLLACRSTSTYRGILPPNEANSTMPGSTYVRQHRPNRALPQLPCLPFVLFVSTFTPGAMPSVVPKPVLSRACDKRSCVGTSIRASGCSCSRGPRI